MHDEPTVVNGDVFVDRLIGYTNLVLGLVLIGVAIYRAATEPELGAVVHFARIGWLVLVAIANISVTRSTLRGMAFAACLFAVRMIYDLSVIRSAPKDRFASMALMYSALMLAYCLFRRRSLKREAPSERELPTRG